jgi:sec-independent protein translocase protein TatA
VDSVGEGGLLMHGALAEIVALDLESGLPIILILVLVLFGGSQLPKLARGLGSAQKEFKKGLEEGAEEKPEAKPKSD